MCTMSLSPVVRAVTLAWLVVVAGCGGSSGPDTGQGGQAQGGASGGRASTTSGGLMNLSGAGGEAVAGRNAGGSAGHGGAKASGGVTASGGAKASGGAMASGGVTASAGSGGRGGATGGGGTCETAADCRLVDDYCTGCDCRALSKAERDPICSGPGVSCLIAPCQDRSVACRSRRCVVE